MPVLWSYPQGPLPPNVEYSVEIEADANSVTVMVARDSYQTPQGIAVAVGGEAADLGEVLSMWEIGFPPEDAPPDDGSR
jgi:hypothetical protein